MTTIPTRRRSLICRVRTAIVFSGFLAISAAYSACDRSPPPRPDKPFLVYPTINTRAVSYKLATKHGDEIVVALHSYKNETGNYPADLHELVPDFLPEIRPSGGAHGQWHYFQRADGASFGLDFPCGEQDFDDTCYPTAYYDNEKGEWRIGS